LSGVAVSRAHLLFFVEPFLHPSGALRLLLLRQQALSALALYANAAAHPLVHDGLPLPQPASVAHLAQLQETGKVRVESRLSGAYLEIQHVYFPDHEKTGSIPFFHQPRIQRA